MSSATWNRFWQTTLSALGKRVLGPLEYTFDVFLMIYLSFRAAVYDQAQGARTIFGVISAQIYFTGWQALPLISVLALAAGSIVILQASTSLGMLAGSNMIGNLMVMIVVRELAPLLTALIVIARSGTAVASEIGNMRVNREIEALEIMGINPLSYIVFPRLVGGIVSVVCLAFYFVVIATMGGFLVSQLVTEISFKFFAETLATAFSSMDMWLFLLKNTFSGAIIFMISCYQGMLVKQSPHEVPQVTTKAVVNSVIYVVVFNLAVTALFYLGKMLQMGLMI